MNPPKRIVTKVGFVYRTKDTSKGHRYLQLVAIDRANLSSDVVVVFAPDEKHNPDDLEQIVKSPAEFYIHTTTAQGVREGLWEKVGKAPVLVELPKLTFKYYRDQIHVDLHEKLATQMNDPKLNSPFAEPYWDVWSIGDEKYRSLNYSAGKSIPAKYGGISPAISVIELIEKRYRFPEKIWPTEDDNAIND